MKPAPLINFGTYWDLSVITLAEGKFLTLYASSYFYRVREMVQFLKIPGQLLTYIQMFALLTYTFLW